MAIEHDPHYVVTARQVKAYKSRRAAVRAAKSKGSSHASAVVVAEEGDTLEIWGVYSSLADGPAPEQILRIWNTYWKAQC